MTKKQEIASSQCQLESPSAWINSLNNSKLKSCLFNLIIYIDEKRSTDNFKEIVELIMRQFPCRIIFIQNDSFSEENYLRLSTVFENKDETHGISCEQVFINVAGEDVQKIPFLILPVLIPDLPIYLFWGQDPSTQSSILPHFLQLVTRIVFDSETITDLQQFTQHMLSAMDISPNSIDMNWMRIGGWKEVLSQVFDSPERITHLVEMQSITITYNDLSKDLFVYPETQAIYLQAWLASRLNWKQKKMSREPGKILIYYEILGEEKVISLVSACDTEMKAEEILSVGLSGPNQCHYQFKRIAINQVEIQGGSALQCEVPITLVMTTIYSGRSFIQEIFYQKISPHYLPMLHLMSLTNWG